MNSFIAYILLCASSVAASDCDTHNAIDVAIGPNTNNEIACGIEAQEMIAQTAIRPRDGEYLKISCVRPRTSAAKRAADGGAASRESREANAGSLGAATGGN
ncbi:MAG: hypothetical protein ACLPNY_23325 [Roseiarcus sp.]